MSPSNDMNAFREIVKKAKHIVILTGAGVSAGKVVTLYSIIQYI